MALEEFLAAAAIGSASSTETVAFCVCAHEFSPLSLSKAKEQGIQVATMAEAVAVASKLPGEHLEDIPEGTANVAANLCMVRWRRGGHRGPGETGALKRLRAAKAAK